MIHCPVISILIRRANEHNHKIETLTPPRSHEIADGTALAAAPTVVLKPVTTPPITHDTAPTAPALCRDTNTPPAAT